MKNIYIIIIVSLLFNVINAQVGIGTTSPQGALDITSSNNGLLIPRVALINNTDAVTVSTLTVSELVYHTGSVGLPTEGYYYWNGTVWTMLSNSVGNNWSLIGNSGTNPTTNFLGTIDTQDLVFRTNNLERFRNFNATGNTSFGSTSDTNNARLNVLANTNTSLSGLFVTQSNAAATTNATYGVNIVNSANSSTGETFGISSINSSTSTGSTTSYGAFFSNNASTVGGIKYGIRNVTGNEGTATTRYGISNRINAASGVNASHSGLYNFYSMTGANASSTFSGVTNEIDAALITRPVGSNTYGLKTTVVHNVASLGNVYGVHNDLGYSDGFKYGIYNRINNSGTGASANPVYGVYNELYGAGTGLQPSYGVYNLLSNNGTAPKHGIYTTSGTTTSNAIYYGTYTLLENTGTGSKYGNYVSIPVTAGGTNYGVYSDVTDTTNDYSGYFLGRVSIGTTTTDNYIFPQSRGTAGQIMVTDGAGIVSWANPGAASSGWSITGNTGTTAGVNFLGTTDNVAIDFRTNNIIKLQLTTKGQIGVFNTGNSIFIGNSAGNADDLTTNENVFIGESAGTATTTGAANIALGSYTLKSNTTLSNNTAIGHQAMENATTNGNITAIGFQALRVNRGANNTGIGFGVLDINTTGANNTAIGSNALGANTIGNNNVAIGTDALKLSDWDSNVAIGSFALDACNLGSRNIAIGHNSLGACTSGNQNIAIGTDALLTSTTSIQNIAIGESALKKTTTIAGNSGSNNLAIGKGVLQELLTGDGNVIVGNFASNSYKGGNYNTAMGYTALQANDTGDYNVAMGNDALVGNFTGSYNVGLGYQVMFKNGSGSNNVGLGDSSGYMNISGSNNVFLGSKAGYNETGSNTLYIENSTTSTPLIGGDFANDKVVINGAITSATHTLTVNGNAKIATLLNLTPGTAPGTPAEGDIYYDSAAKKVRVWTGAAWENLN